MSDEIDLAVGKRMLADEAQTKTAIIELIGEEMYAKLIGWVVLDASAPMAPFGHKAECQVQYSRTEHYQITAHTLRDVADFLRHMLIGEHLPLETDLVEPVTIWVEYHQHLER